MFEVFVSPGRVILFGVAWYVIRYFVRIWPRDREDWL